MENIEIQQVAFDSALQKKSIDLRFKVLRAPLGLTYTAQQLAEEEQEIHIVAQFEDEIIGVLLLKIINADVLKMRQVAVHPEWQNKGVGRQLVQFSEEFARINNYKSIELHARDTAKAFYIALKYSIIGEEFEEVGIPHVKMQKQLS